MPAFARPGGRDQTRGYFRELREAGYIIKRQKRGDGGRLFTEIDVYDVPRHPVGGAIDEFESSTDDGFPGVGISGVGISGVSVNTDSKHPSDGAGAPSDDLDVVARSDLIDLTDTESVKAACYRIAGIIKRRSAPSELMKHGLSWPEIYATLVTAQTKTDPPSYLARVIRNRADEDRIARRVAPL